MSVGRYTGGGNLQESVGGRGEGRTFGEDKVCDRFKKFPGEIVAVYASCAPPIARGGVTSPKYRASSSTLLAGRSMGNQKQWAKVDR